MAISLNTNRGYEVNPLPVIRVISPELSVADLEELFKQAEACEKSRNYATAFQNYQTAARHGHALATVRLGDCYMKGQGIYKDREAAVECYQGAVKLGNLSAMTKLGLCYERGEGVERDADKAVSWYREAAKHKDSEGFYRLAMAYKAGLAQPEGPDDEVVVLLERAVDLQYPYPAAFGELGNIYLDSRNGLTGEERELQNAKALKMFERGASVEDVQSIMCISLNAIGRSEVKEISEVDPEAQELFKQAEACEKRRNYATAFESYEMAANRHHTLAMIRLGDCSMKGQGTCKNPETAVEWYQKAAERGNPSAMTKLGLCYERGEGVKRDTDKAVFLYREAAKHNDSEGLYRLAMAYKADLAKPRRADDEVVVLLERAVDLQYPYPAAFGVLGTIYLYDQLGFRPPFMEIRNIDLNVGTGLTGEERDLRNAKIVKMFRQGVSLGDVLSMRCLASCYQLGRCGLDVRTDMYIELLHKAAGCDDLEAICELAIKYEQGQGVEQNFENAYKMFAQGSSLGDAWSTCKLGNCFREGRGVPQNLPRAAELYRKVLTLDFSPANPTTHVAAMDRLGRMSWEGGKGIQKDRREAVRWLRGAAAGGYQNSVYFLEDEVTPL